MEGVYNFVKITLLGLIVGILIVLVLQLNYLANDFFKTDQEASFRQNNEYRQEMMEKHKEQIPNFNQPNTPKFVI